MASKAAGGDKEAFADIYRQLLDPVYKYLYWNLQSCEEAEDLAEEVFLRCMVNIKSYDPKRGAFKSWLFKIAHNLLIDHHRRNKKGQEPLSEHLEDTKVSTAEQVEANERADYLHQALAKLNELQRQVVSMKYFAGMTNAEAAAALGKSEGAVNAIQHRAMARLGKILEERGWIS